jgi:4-oxalocrotonate tautomerase
MPLVRISLVKGKPEASRRKVGDAVQEPGDLVYDSNYLGIARTSDLVVVQITLSAGRTLEQRRALFRRIAANLGAAVGLRPQDAWINLVEVAKENWSFGNGVASYAPVEAQTA